MSALEALIPWLAPDPSAAAAATLIATLPPPQALDRLDRALQVVAPGLADTERAGWISALAGPLLRAGITTSRRVAAFLGQCAAESAGFRCLEEDLNYTAARLCQVWPARFPDLATAATCALNPERLADHVYADRMGNGDETSGDGWRFRGRGLIQITGRSAFQRFGNAMNMTADEAVAHAVTQGGAAESATWFWSANQLNGLADTWSLDLITRIITGGATDAAERNRLSVAALTALGV